MDTYLTGQAAQDAFAALQWSEGLLSEQSSIQSIHSSNLPTFLSYKDGQYVNTSPKAFLNRALFDDRFNYVTGGVTQVPAIASGNPSVAITANTPVSIPKNGYIYIYVSNESPQPVYFDNVSIQDHRGPLLEENHYYPFGLTMAGISDKAVKTNYTENKYRYNDGSELQNKEFSDGSGLETYDVSFRMYDPQIGRFWQIDPIGEATGDWSPYAYASDNPIYFNDPTGLTDSPRTLPPVTVTPGQNDPPKIAKIVPGGPPTIDVPPPSGTPTNQPAPEPGTAPEPLEEPGPKPNPLIPSLTPLSGTLTSIFTLLPLKAGGDFPNDDEGYWINQHWHPNQPLKIPKPYMGPGNSKENYNPHIVYEFDFVPTDNNTPVLKYGISDEFRWGTDRPESQIAALRAKWGQTVTYKILLRVSDRATALLVEVGLVATHKIQWDGAMPREQLRPNP
jgi:RHS repeat-associated protein